MGAYAEEKGNFDLFPLEEPGPHVASDTRFLGEFFYMLLMLGLLIGVVLFASYILRKMTSNRMEVLNTTSRVKILERRAISQRAWVHVIEIDEKEFLITENVNGIAVIPLQDTKT